MAYINGGGLCLRWLRDQLGEADYESLSRLAEQVLPGCSDLFFLPHFNGRVCPNQPDLRGAYLGLTFAHEKGALYRAILEAIACEYAIFLNILKRNLPNLALTEVRVIGGGARSALFNQIKSDMLNLPYESLQIADTAPLGSALLAARAIGLTDNLRKPVFRLESSAGRWRPDSNNHQQYQTQLHRYEQLLSSMNVIYQQGKG
jgi:xylulokinase